MEGIETEVSVSDAVGFLTTRVVEEARRDSVHLTDAEIKQLSFTEETATAEEIAAARAFDGANDTDGFEAKISKLLRNAFDHDVERGMRSLWQKHLASLRNHDVYVLVMVDQAGIPRPKPSVRLRPSAKAQSNADQKTTRRGGGADNRFWCCLLHHFAHGMASRRSADLRQDC